MTLPLGASSPPTFYPFPHFYGWGYGYRGRIVPRKPAAAMPPARAEVGDIVVLSLAAQRIIDQAERLKKMQINT